MSKILVFDIKSKMAHFRKFYTNSSSLSYYFPPKTTVSGMIAALLGMQRDSYYEVLGEPAKLAVQIRTALRKKLTVVNYLLVKEAEDIRGRKGGTQIPVEFVLSNDFREGLTYRVYFTHEDKAIYTSLKETLERRIYRYPLYAGITELPATAHYVGEFEGQELTSEEPVPISVPVNVEFIEKISELMFDKRNKNVHKDRMPIEFTAERRLKKIGDFLFRPDPEPIYMNLKIPYLRVDALGTNIVFT